MISIISATNRPNSKTAIVANKAYFYVKEIAEEPVKLLSLEKLSGLQLDNAMYTGEHQSKIITALQDEFMIPATKFIFVMPEYNGSFPGILKFFIDACSIREYKATFSNKKAGLIGVASGRAGNIRGIDHFRGILSHVGTNVMSGILPVSSIEACLEEDGQLNAKTSAAIEDYVKGFCAF